MEYYFQKNTKYVQKAAREHKQNGLGPYGNNVRCVAILDKLCNSLYLSQFIVQQAFSSTDKICTINL